jgi:hypothetical protein
MMGLALGLIAFGTGESQAAPLFPGLTAPMSCGPVPLGTSGSVMVEAGKSPSGDVPYPKDVPCPGVGNSGTCSEYNLKFTYTGGNPNHSAVSVSSDLDIFATNPSAVIEDPVGAGDATTNVGQFVNEQRTVRFNENGSVFFASVTTKKSIARVGSAGGRIGTKYNSCLIATPGSIVSVDPHAVIAGATTFTPNPTESAACSVDVKRDASGRIVSVLLTPAGIAAGCTQTEGTIDNLVIGGLPVEFVGSGFGNGNELIVLGSTHSCIRYVYNGKVTYVDPLPNPPNCFTSP